MVYRRKRRRTFKRKSYAKRPYYRSKRRMVYRRKRRGFAKIGGSQGFSAQAVAANRAVKLRYVYLGTVTASDVTGFGQVSFRANSIYDPVVSIGGHQPMGYDTLESLYNHYTVVGSKIRVQMSNRNAQPQTFGIYLADTTTALGSMPTYMESKQGAWRLCGNGNEGIKQCTYKFSARKFFNVVNVKDHLSLGADMGNDPARPAYFNVWIFNQTGVAVSPEITVTIEYLVVCDDPVAPYQN